MKFKIECEMEPECVAAFYGLLNRMERNGNIGHSEDITFFDDGDGMFRPKFAFADFEGTGEEFIRLVCNRDNRDTVDEQ